MTPTLWGRIQSRLLLVLIVGGIWTLLVTPFIKPFSASVSSAYFLTFAALLIVTFVGVIWELIYHGLQQTRWEKDWPTLFGLLTGIPEFFTTAFWLAVVTGDRVIPPLTFFLHFFSTWIVVWLFANGPIRILFPRWRFNGGRFT